MLQRKNVLYFPYKSIKKVPQPFDRGRAGGEEEGKGKKREGKEPIGLSVSIAVPGEAVLRDIKRNFIFINCSFQRKWINGTSGASLDERTVHKISGWQRTTFLTA